MAPCQLLLLTRGALVIPLLLALPTVSLSAAARADDALAPRVPLPKMELAAVDLPDRPAMGHQLRIKLRDEVLGRATSAGALRSESGADLSPLRGLLDELGLDARPTIDLDPQRILDLEQRAEARTGRQAADLQGMLTLDGLERGEDMVAAGQRLQALDVVEYAYVSVVGAPPPGDIGTTTSDYSSRQTYLDEDPGTDAWSAWEEGLTGTGIRVSDVEYGWIFEHEDLVDVDIELESGETVPDWVASYGWDYHGTAVLGELVAPDNGYGVTGAVHEAGGVGTYPEYTDDAGSRRPAAIASAAADSVEGDLVLLEMQTVARRGGDYCPAETDPDVFTVVETAVDAGVVVVAAAGNGSEDLDSGWYELNYLSWGDSGAIIVGAGSSDTDHEPMYFTTYGDRVNVQGWGENVTTLGYGYLAYVDSEREQSYTASFNGTSSASPIVTGAAALVQDYALSALGEPLSPEGLRSLLIETGIPQTGSEHIGPLPDIMAAIDELDVDGDGQVATDYGGEDCDDSDADIYEGATDSWYDGVDSDCDGASDYDADADGVDSDDYGGEDCDDSDPAVLPGVADAWYDGIDSDCDGASDYDADGDGDDAADYGGGDCDDADATVSSLVSETWYDGIDSDCDGASDYDADGDGDDAADYGGGDCDDTDTTVSSLATETWYDGIDADCAGDDDYDADGDGQDSSDFGGEDCDDTDGSVYVGADDAWYDGVDSNCDGASDYDADGDGQDSAEHEGEDCDDTDPTIFAGAEEVLDDGIDQDCDGEDAVEETGDGGASDGGAGDGGAGDGGAGDGGAGDGGAGDGGAGDGGAGDGGAGDGGTEGLDGGSDDEGDGKSCSSLPARSGLGFVLVGLLGLVGRRRR